MLCIAEHLILAKTIVYAIMFTVYDQITNLVVGSCRGFFFFKHEPAYEMLRSLVGSEVCIRDRARLHLEKKKKKVINKLLSD